MKQPSQKQNADKKASQKSGKTPGKNPGKIPGDNPIAQLKKRNQNLRAQNEKLSKENEALKTSITHLVAELDIARNDIKSYTNSTSWRITKPMRMLKSWFQ